VRLSNPKSSRILFSRSTGKNAVGNAIAFFVAFPTHTHKKKKKKRGRTFTSQKPNAQTFPSYSKKKIGQASIFLFAHFANKKKKKTKDFTTAAFAVLCPVLQPAATLRSAAPARRTSRSFHQRFWRPLATTSAATQASSSFNLHPFSPANIRCALPNFCTSFSFLNFFFRLYVWAETDLAADNLLKEILF